MNKGIIKFYGYKIERMIYSRVKEYKVDDGLIDLSPEFLISLIFNKDNPQKCNVIIGVRIGYLNDKTPFKSDVILRGYYETEEKISSKEELIKLFLINGSAILFPYLRSVLTDITSKSDHTPVILPTFNFHTITDDINIDDIIVDSSEYEEFGDVDR